MPLSGQRILLVEDEFLTAFYVESIVREAHGEVVAHAASLAKAMTLAATPNLSLAILDFSLGSNNSLRVAAKLRAFGVPFIFHSGSNLVVVSKENEEFSLARGNCSPPALGWRSQCAMSTVPPARQVRIAANAVRPRSVPVAMTEQTAA